jgi:hypothetical protein
MTDEEIYKFSTNLFWDSDTQAMNMEQHASYIVARVLDYGHWQDWLFIREYYGMERIKEIVLGIRSLKPESLSFVATVTGIQENQFRCYEQLHSPNIHWRF